MQSQSNFIVIFLFVTVIEQVIVTDYICYVITSCLVLSTLCSRAGKLRSVMYLQ